ncbi:SETMR methyltransferase, partial [Acromyrmex heyeri]
MLWSREQRAFAVESFFCNGRSVVATQRAFRARFEIPPHRLVPGRNSILSWVNSFQECGSNFLAIEFARKKSYNYLTFLPHCNHRLHSTSVPAFATVYNWVNEFKRGRTSTCDAPRSGVPRLLTVDHKRDRVMISKQCLEMFQHNPNEFLRRFITVDKTWIHYFTPETKEQSKQSTSPSEPAPKKAKTVKWAEKVGDYYAALLDRFNNILKKKRPHLAKKKVLFHQDNARVHTCSALMTKFNEFRYELFPHPAYSPDLAPETEAYFEELNKSYYSEGLKKLENRIKESESSPQLSISAKNIVTLKCIRPFLKAGSRKKTIDKK